MGMKRIVGVMVAGMVLAGPSQVASAQSSDTEVLAFRGFGASAVFRTIEGCIATEVFVSAGESRAVRPGEPETVKQDAAAVLLDRRDQCTGEVFLFGSGSGPVEFDAAPLLELGGSPRGRAGPRRAVRPDARCGRRCGLDRRGRARTGREPLALRR
jgi:hypothetical protein